MGTCQEKLEGVGGTDCATTTQGGLVGAFCERTLKKTTGKVVLPMEPGMAVALCGLGRVTVTLSMWLRRLSCPELGSEDEGCFIWENRLFCFVFPARSSFPSPLRLGEMKDRWRDEGQMEYRTRIQWRDQAMAKTPRMKNEEP